MANQRFSGDIDKLLNSVNSRILISDAPSNNIRVQGFMVSDFSISGGNSYTNIFGSSSQEIADSALKTATSLINFVSGKTGISDVKISERKLMAINSTIHSWVGSNRPSFNIPLIFVAIRESDDVRTPVKSLTKSVYPTEDGIFMIAPLGYDGTGGGTVSIQIGKWLMIHGLVVTSMNATFSQQVIKSGLPLYAKVDITFEPYKLPTVKDVDGYFI
jgi:hypothetical protein